MLDDGDDKPTGEPNTSEWPLFYLAGTAELLGSDLPAASREPRALGPLRPQLRGLYAAAPLLFYRAQP